MGIDGATESSGEQEEVGRISRQPIYRGRIVDLSVDTVRFPGGSTGTLELITHPGASAVLPFVDFPLAADPRIILVHQYRYAAGGRLYEVPAGIPNDQDEPWVDCARRELSEETGLAADEMRYLSCILTTPGFTDERIHLFAATGMRPTPANRDHDEFIEVVEVRRSRALEWIRRGEITDAKTVATLLFASAFLDTVWDDRREAPPR